MGAGVATSAACSIRRYASPVNVFGAPARWKSSVAAGPDRRREPGSTTPFRWPGPARQPRHEPLGFQAGDRAFEEAGALTVEAALGATSSRRRRLLRRQVAEQDPIVSTQLPLIYEFRGWALARNQRHLLPRRAHHRRRREAERRAIDHAGRGDARATGRPPSIAKLHASTACPFYGDDFTTVGAAWQYRWGGGF